MIIITAHTHSKMPNYIIHGLVHKKKWFTNNRRSKCNEGVGGGLGVRGRGGFESGAHPVNADTQCDLTLQTALQNGLLAIQ